MAYKKALSSALSRSLDDAKNSLARAMRMDVMAPTTADHESMLLYGLRTKQDLGQMAIGCDGDIGGLSTARIEVDPAEGKGRFFGTLSSELPRGAKLERSGYAGMRNKARSTLFGSQTWDTTVYPYIRLRVRDRLARPPSPQARAAPTSPLRSALSTGLARNAPVSVRATHALGLNLPPKPGPKFFVNVQTDGPVTSDLFQHRLLLDESKGNAWQDVIIPLGDFILTNSGQVSQTQMRMMREAIRTVGISAILDNPQLHLPEYGTARGKEDPLDATKPPSALRREDERTEMAGKAEAEALRSCAGQTTAGTATPTPTTTPARGSRRGASYNFDLGLDSIDVMSEDAIGVEKKA